MQETMVNQTQKSFTPLPVLYNKSSVIPAPYDLGQEITQLLSILREEETSNAYQKAAATTWMIIKRLVVLILFTFSLVIALLIWVYGIGFQAGFHFRKWLEVEQPPIEKVTSRLLEYLGLPFRQAFTWATWFVKEYLHWEISFDSSNDNSNSLTQAPTPAETEPHQK